MPSRANADFLMRRCVVAVLLLAIVGPYTVGSTVGTAGPTPVITDFPVYALAPDPFFVDQWGLREIQADLAWGVTNGSRSIVVAVVDTGVWWTHQDLQANMWINPADGSTHGYDFINRDTNPMDVDPSGLYHGTGVAGVIAAITNNGQDIAGTAQVSVMALRALGPSGQGSSLNTSEAIRWAARNGARVINLSLGTNESFGGPTDIQLAIDYAWSQGALIVAAAGNGGADQVGDPALDYPARLRNVVSVAALGENGRRASFSNYGTGLGITAPGERILTLNGNNGLHYLFGTSFAAPFVTATAALLLSVDPALTNRELWDILNGTAVQPSGFGTGYNTDYGWGVVNVLNAMDALSVPFVSVTSFPGSVSRSSTFDVTWSVRGPTGLTVTDTHLVWGTRSGLLGNATAVQSGQTRMSYTATGLAIPSGADALYFKVVGVVNGTTYESAEKLVTVSNLPDFLFVLYQMLASNLLLLALFIIVLAGIVAFLPQRRAARARRAAGMARTMYPPTYYAQAVRPSGPPYSQPQAPPAAAQYSPTAPSAGPPAYAPDTRSAPMAPLPTAAPAKKRCPNCGTTVNADNLFCFFCGNPFR